MKKPTGFNKVLDQIVQYLIFSYQAVVVVAFLAMPFWAIGFNQQPFLGVFLEHTLVTNGIGVPNAPEWVLRNQGLDVFGNQLLSLSSPDKNGNTGASAQPKSYDDIAAFLAGHSAGDAVRATFQLTDGSVKAFDLNLTQLTFSDQMQFFAIPYFVGLVYLVVSLWIFGMRRSETAARAFSFFATSVAVAVGTLFDLYTTHRLTYLWVFAIPMVGASLFHLGMVFPQETRVYQRYPLLRFAGYGLAALLALWSMSTLFDFGNRTIYAGVWAYSYYFTGAGILFFLSMLIYRWTRSPSPVVRQQARTTALGAVASFTLIAFWLLHTAVPNLIIDFNPYIYFLPLVVFPATTGYTVSRYRLLRTDYMIWRGTLYIVLTTLALGSYVLLAYGLSIATGLPVQATNPLLVGVSLVVMVILLNPVRTWLQRIIDTVFFRGERAHQERLRIFSRELTNSTDLNSILRILRDQITVSLLPSQLHIYIYDPSNDQYIATADETKQLTSDIRFSANSPLPTVLREESLPLFVDQERPPEAVTAERGRLALLGAQLFIPLPGRDRLIGWLALGERLSGESYASHDIAFLESLTTQSAVAFERAQVVNNMERRVNEMNALARVAQGINITLNFDDILELIFAQTLQIMPGNDFHLMLYNKTAQYFYYAFFLENDERIPQKEILPVSAKSTLDQEIILTRRPILTQDFVGQCQIMGITPSTRGLYAWLGVPLNTGLETIGALSITSRDPAVTYTPVHMDLLQAIADQAAGAIVKSRLLQETERRAQQLSILNVITRQLTSTLDLEPLLKNILENAVTILSSEAGSLFLVDEQTDELIFRVTVGPVASNLVGQRLPPGTGFVGKAVTARQAVIVNDVQSSSSYNPSTDKQTGFITKTILAVPMEVKDRVIGVIEIINKKDDLPFTEDDQNLLTAFSGQAAVAIENARLYTLTDQELTARVEELSVMQRIDRELNASLEVDRAMRITLEWAMRQSQAEAGAIGFVQEKGVRLVADLGYGRLLEKYQEEYLPLDHPAVAEAIKTGQPQRKLFERYDPERAFLTGAHSQMVVPIRREADAIGLFLLESTNTEGFQQDALNFLSRLSDHSAIAISNAQLYAEVRAANIAKSKFVDFVAHELKQPMTSMKGFSDLMAAGAAGPITETQGNFLNTIRSNMSRMQTIVQDLNDNSKIEAGTLEIKFQVVELADVLDEVNRSIKRQLEDKKQKINMSVPQSLSKVWADRGRVIQVLVNLISNAHKYTPEGGEIDVGAEEAENSWDPQGASRVVHVWVKDNGIGISPENQKKIFTPFYRARDDEEAMKSPGTGLGLNITKNLVEMQGGRIWFESEFRKGTTFHIIIPVSESIPVSVK